MSKPPFVENTKTFFSTVEEYELYKEISTIQEPIVIYLKKYIERNICNKDTRDFINKILRSGIIFKCKLCNDGSYRNNSILIRPDGPLVTNGDFTLENFESYFIENDEILWLNMTDETWKEVDGLLDIFHYDDLW